MWTLVACCHGAKHCAYAAWDFRSQHNGAVTRMWRSCGVQRSHKERAIGAVCCKKEGMLLQPLWWCCVDCVIHHERDVCEEQHHAYMWREQVIIEWSWHVNCIVACYHRTKLCAYAARDFRSQHHHNLWRLCLNVCYVLDLTFVLLYYCFILCYVVICYLCGLYFQPFKK